ncbi:sulfite exporter TauE/SafE family protein [Scatolibacter rhodanostii]|uniref:sulfite exporter TauE/SafE family protein n=1 Tax=Scatolibacter rhodanostii TaxID=2014781 RepID=UPI00135656FB|nr:sulfite exporter TauE/SafE family protein [Scatolibacter rhodanostii]
MDSSPKKTMWWIDVLIGTATGILSGFGIGGGTLLILWLTLFAGLNQLQAGGINLLYFVFSAVPALISHAKNKLIDKKILIFCIIGGIPSCIIASLIASQLDVTWLRKGFGVLLLFIGIKELFSPKQDTKK